MHLPGFAFSRVQRCACLSVYGGFLFVFSSFPYLLFPVNIHGVTYIQKMQSKKNRETYGLGLIYYRSWYSPVGSIYLFLEILA